MKTALLLSLVTALLPCAHAQFVSCAQDVFIRSQDDADELKQCNEFSGRVVFTSEATGDISIVGPKNIGRGFTNFDCMQPNISGSIYPTDCFRYNSSVRSIYSNIVSFYGVDFIGGFDELIKISLPNLSSATEFELVSLPKLETVEADKLLAENGVYFVTLADLPKLETLTPDGKVLYSGRFNATKTGLKQLNVLPLPKNLSDTPGMAVKDSKPIEEFVVLPVAKTETMASISVAGSGDASVELTVVGEDGIDLLDFSLSGVKELNLDTMSNPKANISAKSLNITGNSLETLPIPLNAGDPPDLIIAGNPELKTVHFGNTTMLKGWINLITIANNSKLHLSSTYNHEDNDTTWVWPGRSTRNMTFIGDFNMEFFDTFINYKNPELEETDSGPHFFGRRPHVFGRLIVKSTAEDLECTKLKTLVTKSGHNPGGVLECNGREYLNDSGCSRTVPIPGLMVSAAAFLLSMVLLRALCDI